MLIEDAMNEEIDVDSSDSDESDDDWMRSHLQEALVMVGAPFYVCVG